MRAYNYLTKKEEAIEKAEENCQRYKDFMTYGVPSLEDRLPSTTTSVLSMARSSVRNDKNLIINYIAEEADDYKFMSKMNSIFNDLEPLYLSIITIF